MSTPSIGLYVPGRSAVHRAPAGAKLAVMFAAIIVVVALRLWWQLAIAAGIVMLLYAWAHIPPRIAWAQIRPLRYLIPILAALQWYLADWQTALRICSMLLLTVGIAALVTVTTRISAMLDTLCRALGPLRRVGVDPDRIALLLATTIRCIPLVAGIVGAVTEARKARGLGFSVVALGAPVVIRSLRAADALGEALIARGADD